VPTLPGVSSRQEQKLAARAARQDAERDTEGAARRRRRLTQLGGLVLVAAVVVAVLVAVSSGGGSSKTAGPKTPSAADAGSATTLLGGIPQAGLTLGRPSAPVTLVEYNDMQCPVCREYTSAVFPTLVQRYVRTGKVRMEMRLQSFIGPDSVTGARAVAAAGRQNRAWTFADTFYTSQQQENSGYVTDGFLRSIAAATPGLNADRLLTDMSGAAAKRAVSQGSADFDAHRLSGTPSFLIGKTGGAMSVLSWSQLTPDQFTGPIDALLGG
jgi:protein-disulfide isomerase